MKIGLEWDCHIIASIDPYRHVTSPKGEEYLLYPYNVHKKQGDRKREREREREREAKRVGEGERQNMYTIHIHMILCINKYIYSHPQTDCFVVSQLFSVATQVGLLKLGSKPAHLYVRLSIRPLGQQAYHVG